MIKFDLDEIIRTDEFNLLAVKKKSHSNQDDNVTTSFMEINEFYRDNNRLPENNKNPIESKLYARYQTIISNTTEIQNLKPHDIYDILVQKPLSIEDILNNDEFGLLDNDVEKDLTTFKYVSNKKPINKVNEVGKTIKCKDFHRFEHLFMDCNRDLEQKTRHYVPVSESDIKQGLFFVLKGVMGYIAHIGDPAKATKNRNKNNHRLRIIYSNGTESNILSQSLIGNMHEHKGKLISRLYNHTFSNITEDDNHSGHIYVLQSLSTNEKITSIKNLYKIGFTTQTIEQRTKNAINDPTFLMDNIKVVKSYKAYNMNPHKFEAIIHKFFNNCNILLQITDNNNKTHTPKEWFTVPEHIIVETIHKILDESIVKYQYNNKTETIDLIE